jgi:hypothetical protein
MQRPEVQSALFAQTSFLAFNAQLVDATQGIEYPQMFWLTSHDWPALTALRHFMAVPVHVIALEVGL